MPKKGPDPEKRSLILSVLEKNPQGLWMRELARRTGLPFSTVQYYVTHLLSGDVEVEEFPSQARLSPIKLVKLKTHTETKEDEANESVPEKEEEELEEKIEGVLEREEELQKEEPQEPQAEEEDPLQIIATFIKNNIRVVRELASEAREISDKVSNATTPQDLESVIRQARDCREKIEDVENELDKLLENLGKGARK